MLYNKLLSIFFACCLLCHFSNKTVAQSQTAFAIYFKDKNPTTYRLHQPAAYLSTKAISRRMLHEINVDSTDLPVCATYIDSILNHTQGIYHNQSKWLNCVVILLSDTQKITDVRLFDFVGSVSKVGYFNFALHQTIPDTIHEINNNNFVEKTNAFNEQYYGAAWQQIALTKGQVFHHNSMEGTGVNIAVIDASFKGVDTIEAFQHLFTDNKIIDKYNFNRNTNDVFIDGQHGTQVLSTMAAFAPGKMVGTAPKANYALYYTEHSNTEQPIEMYNLVAALERADSVGCHIINISLGYNEFDNSNDDFSYADLDGTKTVAAKGVNHAYNKGIACIVAAGNEGNSSWKHLLTPADAIGALTVGSVDEFLTPSHFTGLGFANTNKPDIASMRSEAAIIKNDGSIVRSFGTSFAAPIITGLIACYIQAYPNHKIPAIYEYVKSIGHLGISGFNNTIGTGVPNFANAMTTESFNTNNFLLFPNPAKETIYINNNVGSFHYTIFDATGASVLQENNFSEQSIDIKSLPAGIYFISILKNDGIYHDKFIKE